MKYLRPTTLHDACALLAQPKSLALAGGTDVVPRLEAGRPLPETLIDLKTVPELTGVRQLENGSLEIGALTTVHELLHNPIVANHCPALTQSARDFAAVQIRHRATVGGNLCNASPAGDTLPPLYAANASVVIASADSERELPVNQFITNPGKTALQPGETLRAIVLPSTGEASLFVKLGLRDAMAISVVNFAIAYQLENDRFTSLRIAAGAVAPTVVLLDDYVAAICDNPANITQAIDLVDNAISPIDDVRATATYRSTVLKRLLIHSLSSMLESDDA